MAPDKYCHITDARTGQPYKKLYIDYMKDGITFDVGLVINNSILRIKPQNYNLCHYEKSTDHLKPRPYIKVTEEDHEVLNMVPCKNLEHD